MRVYKFLFSAEPCVIYSRPISLLALVVKNPIAHAGDVKDMGLVPGSGRSPGGGRGNPLQFSRLENPVDRGDWQATVHRVAQNQTQLKQLGMHISQHKIHFHPFAFCSGSQEADFSQAASTGLPSGFWAPLTNGRHYLGTSMWMERETGYFPSAPSLSGNSL